MIIDATDLILGRMASVVAKKALLGEKIDIVNCENAVIIGSKQNILQKYWLVTDKTQPRRGPFFYRMPDRFVRRTIKRMLPHKKDRGLKAFKRVMCHIGVPDEFKNGKIETIEQAKIIKSNVLGYVAVRDICRLIGGKFK